MSATQAHLDELNRIRAERAFQAQQQGQQTPAPQPAPQPQSSGAGGAVGNVAGTGAGMAAGNYVANTVMGANAAGAGATGAGAAGVGSGSVAVGGSAAPVVSTTTLPSVTAVGGGSSSGAAAAPAAGTGVTATGAMGAAALAYGAYRGYMGAKGKSASQAAKDDEWDPYQRITGVVSNPASIWGSNDSFKNKLGHSVIDSALPLGLGAHVSAQIGSGKDVAQLKRDQIRAAMQEQGALDEGWNLTLADGGKFNIGLDGGGKIMGKDGKEINPYNVDASNPFAHQATAWADPIAAILTGGDPKLRSDFAGYFTNAAMSNANTLEGVRANLLNIMASHKIDFPTARKAVTSMLEAGKIDQATHDIYMNTLGILESGDSKRYDTRTVQEVMAASAPPATGAPVVPPVPPNQAGLPVPGPVSTLPLVVPPGTLPSAKGAIPGTTGVPRLTPPAPALGVPANQPVAAAPPIANPNSVAGRPISSFQKLIDEAKRREQMSGVTNGR